MTIGQQIKEARENKGLMPKYVADKCGIDRSYLTKVENDKVSAGKPLVKLLEILLDTKFE